MQLNDSPEGKWWPLLVGAFWPSSASTESAVTASRNRASVAEAFDNQEHTLFQARTGPLAEQEGLTAETARNAFVKGEGQLRDIADKNRTKQAAYTSAAQALEGLKSDLRNVAAVGSSAIDLIQTNSLIADKVGAIVGVITVANEEAGRKSLSWSSPISDAIQRVLTANGDMRTPEKFASDHGILISEKAATPSESDLKSQVSSLMDGHNELANVPSNESLSSLSQRSAETPQVTSIRTAPPTDDSTAAVNNSAGAGPGRGFEGAASPPANDQPALSSLKQTGVEVGPTIESPGTISSNASGGLASTTPGATAGGSFASPPSGPASLGGSAAGSASLPSSGGLGSGTGTPSLSPESLAQSFNTGMQAGAPASAGAEALSQGISDTVQSQTPQNHTPPPAPVAPTVPSSGFAYEAPQQYSEPVQAAPATETHAQPMYAAPVAAAPAAPMAPMAAAPPAATAGPLPAYGSDLRPATAAAPPPPAAPAPMSAPTTAASGTAASNQAPVVRQQNMTTPGSTTTPTGIVESALTSATAGAVAGAAAEQSAAQARLDRLLEAVARQEPKLKWAIGDREDGSTVLVTDLAAGWIPPHIEIPKGVQLLPPERRRGGLEHLLGETVDHSIWTPGHYLPNAKDVEPFEMTYRARQVPDIDELNWELTQATNWRDGLPRLAHTLTKAGIAGTGVLETEADLLYEHLTTVRNKVVKSYPDSVDANDVGNWQLLAAISGLISSDKTTLKYHFAWFQALSMAKQGGAR